MIGLSLLLQSKDQDIALKDELIQVANWVAMGDIETPHSVVQHLEGTPEADFWHGIIHRLEGDSSNAKYWFRRCEPLWLELGLDPISLTNDRDHDKEAHEWRVLTIHGLKRLGFDVI
jgi:hypothetical protein